MLDEKGLCAKKLMLYDEACLHIRNTGIRLLSVFTQTTECYNCSYIWRFNVNPGATTSTTVRTTYGTLLKFINGKSTFSTKYTFGQHGHYNINISDVTQTDIRITVQPEDAYAPLKLELWILVTLFVLWSIGSCSSYYYNSFRRFFQPPFVNTEFQNDLGTPSGSGEPAPLLTADVDRPSPQHSSRGTTRFKSLDVFRGITIVLMLFVNYGGGKYSIFEHSPWNGITIADVVFPWFAWIMGCSLLLSLFSRFRVSSSRRLLLQKVTLRSSVILVIGLCLNSFGNNDLRTFRIPGVLQRLALSYFFVGIVETFFIQIRLDRFRGKLSAVQDWLSGWFQWLLFLSCALVHVLTLKFVEIPGCPRGYLGPGGFHDNSTVRLCTGGFAGYVDRLTFLPSHLYTRPSLVKVYGNGTAFDPEGLLGLLSTIFNVYLGVHATRTYLSFKRPKDLLLRWITLGIITGSLAGHFCGWSKEEGLIPINKNLWSVTFVLATSSLAFFIIAFLYFTIDYKGWWSGSPFQEVGKNAIFIYVFSVLTKNSFPWRWKPIDLTTHASSLVVDTWATLVWILIGVGLSKKNIIITI